MAKTQPAPVDVEVKRVAVQLAGPIADRVPIPTVIVIDDRMTSGLTDEEYMANGVIFEKDAKALFDALLAALPGGTFCQLLGLMLQEKASHFIVPHLSPESNQSAPKAKADVAMYRALLLGDSLGNSGAVLLNHAADILTPFAPVTADELRRKATAEHNAILAASGDTDLTEELVDACEAALLLFDSDSASLDAREVEQFLRTTVAKAHGKGA
jgi:hypothetical protein